MYSLFNNKDCIGFYKEQRLTALSEGHECNVNISLEKNGCLESVAFSGSWLTAGFFEMHSDQAGEAQNNGVHTEHSRF